MHLTKSESRRRGGGDVLEASFHSDESTKSPSTKQLAHPLSRTGGLGRRTEKNRGFGSECTMQGPNRETSGDRIRIPKEPRSKSLASLVGPGAGLGRTPSGGDRPGSTRVALGSHELGVDYRIDIEWIRSIKCTAGIGVNPSR